MYVVVQYEQIEKFDRWRRIIFEMSGGARVHEPTVHAGDITLQEVAVRLSKWLRGGPSVQLGNGIKTLEPDVSAP